MPKALARSVHNGQTRCISPAITLWELVSSGFYRPCVKKAEPNRYAIEPDRVQAIVTAISELSSGDVLLICGKGSELHQYMIGDKARPEPYIGDQKAVNQALNIEL